MWFFVRVVKIFVLFGKYKNKKSRLHLGNDLVGYMTVLIVNLNYTDNNSLNLCKTLLQQNLHHAKIVPFGHPSKEEVS